MTVVTAVVAGRRAWWLFQLIRSGRPATGRLENLGARIKAEIVEVFGQKRLLKWSIPGVAHFLTFWGFVILFLTIIEAFGALFVRDFPVPVIGRWAVVGFLEDLFAIAVLVGIVAFAILRLQQAPEKLDRKSRFYGSHTGAAWGVLGMISLVIITLLIYRGAQWNTGHFPFGQTRWAFASWWTAEALAPLGRTANDWIETIFVLGNLAVIFAFLVIVLHSKHLHIGLAPINVVTKRLPHGLGPLQPIMDNGKPIDFEEADPEKVPFGVGQVEDFTWKGLLDFSTCTECGRCQSQCPAWNTGKPLSPKLLIMNLRDNAFAKAPYILAGGHKDPTGEEQATEQQLSKVNALALAEAERPLVGTAEEGGVIDPDVLWSCTTCGACVEQCPVDIEHVDHIVDMRRYQVMIESSFPSEAGVMLRNLENKGNPWGASQRDREDWTKALDFEVPRATGPEDDFEYLFWVGCAGAFDDQAKKTTRAVATLLNEAGVKFAILGEGETCTGDPARRVGNEFLFQMMAQQTTETLNEVLGGGDGNGADRPAKKIVATCPHCFNTLANEYGQLGGHFDVVHHTQLLATLVADGKLTPVQQVDGDVTYHDPCYLGRHNRVFAPPREVLGAVTSNGGGGSGGDGSDGDGSGGNGSGGLIEMERFAERSFCCGAGGARMWMEERIGQRVNINRVEEAIGTGAKTVAVSCPFCMTMLDDGVTSKKSSGEASEDVEVVDVATVLLRSVKPDAQSGK
ncbi:MAG: (Fe-S)-binding protein [Micromonosporaceae bacterium]